MSFVWQIEKPAPHERAPLNRVALVLSHMKPPFDPKSIASRTQFNVDYNFMFREFPRMQAEADLQIAKLIGAGSLNKTGIITEYET